jgi:hypothetical protein
MSASMMLRAVPRFRQSAERGIVYVFSECLDRLVSTYNLAYDQPAQKRKSMLFQSNDPKDIARPYPAKLSACCKVERPVEFSFGVIGSPVLEEVAHGLLPPNGSPNCILWLCE